MHWMDGMANHRLGLAGEELTADELQRLRNRGWRVVHHVMLAKGEGDIDHAVLGPGGFFAVDSKYRTDWSSAQSNIDDLARRSRRQATALQSRLQVREPKVRPAVILWGPRVSKVFDDVFDHDGVLFCVGPAFVEHVSSRRRRSRPSDNRSGLRTTRRLRGDPRHRRGTRARRSRQADHSARSRPPRRCLPRRGHIRGDHHSDQAPADRRMGGRAGRCDSDSNTIGATPRPRERQEFSELQLRCSRPRWAWAPYSSSSSPST